MESIAADDEPNPAAPLHQEEIPADQEYSADKALKQEHFYPVYYSAAHGYDQYAHYRPYFTDDSSATLSYLNADPQVDRLPYLAPYAGVTPSPTSQEITDVAAEAKESSPDIASSNLHLTPSSSVRTDGQVLSHQSDTGRASVSSPPTQPSYFVDPVTGAFVALAPPSSPLHVLAPPSGVVDPYTMSGGPPSGYEGQSYLVPAPSPVPVHAGNPAASPLHTMHQLAHALPPHPHMPPNVPVMRSCGTVKFFNSQKGYGFIIPDEGELEVFVHHTAILKPDGGFRSLAEGEKVEYDLHQGPKGLHAANVSGPNGAGVLGDPKARTPNMFGQGGYSNGSHPSHPHLQGGPGGLPQTPRHVRNTPTPGLGGSGGRSSPGGRSGQQQHQQSQQQQQQASGYPVGPAYYYPTSVKDSNGQPYMYPAPLSPPQAYALPTGYFPGQWGYPGVYAPYPPPHHPQVVQGNASTPSMTAGTGSTRSGNGATTPNGTSATAPTGTSGAGSSAAKEGSPSSAEAASSDGKNYQQQQQQLAFYSPYHPGPGMMHHPQMHPQGLPAHPYLPPGAPGSPGGGPPQGYQLVQTPQGPAYYPVSAPMHMAPQPGPHGGAPAGYAQPLPSGPSPTPMQQPTTAAQGSRPAGANASGAGGPASTTGSTASSEPTVPPTAAEAVAQYNAAIAASSQDAEPVAAAAPAAQKTKAKKEEAKDASPGRPGRATPTSKAKGGDASAAGKPKPYAAAAAANAGGAGPTATKA
ncbi:Calcium-regulated heat stable protein 1 [Phlyctochytrium bullatum]|nr:Calcium-regulated heat stable protein 1 [Phlyctochytrium bullatum]